jgi:type IV secretory pathway VirB10-like protein
MAKLSLAAKFGNTKSRTVVLFFGVVFLVAIAVALSRLTGAEDELTERSSQTSAIPRNIKAVPGNKTPEKYRELQMIDNERRAQNAKRQGDNLSAIPTIVHTDVVKGTRGGFGLLGNEILHGEGTYGPYGLNEDASTPFGVGPDGKVYDTQGYQIHGYGPNGPYGIGPDGKPFGIGPDGKPYGIGPDGKPFIGLGPDGEIIYIGPDGKPIDPEYLQRLRDEGYLDYVPGGPKYTDALRNNEAGFQIHGYGPNGPYGVDADGNPFGIGPDGQPYDPNGPFAPEWYDPPRKTPAEIAQSRLDEERERIERMRQERLSRLENQQEQQAEKRQLRVDAKSVEESASLMDNQAKALFQAWSTVTPQYHVYGNQFPEMIDAQKEAMQGPLATTVAAPPTTGAGTIPGPNDEVITAGTVLYAVIDTSVNSDENGPVLASVVHGDYKGARLIGAFSPPTINSESLTVKFTRIVIPEANVSLPIEAVAVDPDTARTAVSTDVDHHYLLRYGSLFASAFMEGYGKAVKEAGSSRVENSDGSTTTSTADLSGEEELYAAFGNVGTQWGAQAAPLFNTLPTITIDSGTGVGILFMTDLNVTEKLQG